MKPASLVLAAVLAGALILFRARLGKTHLALGAAILAWFVARGTGLVHLPDIEDAAREIGPSLGGWTYVVVGLLAFLETAFFVGLVAPGELAVVLGGFIAGQGEIEVAPLGATVFLCAAAGDTTSYYLGRKLGRGFLLTHGGSFGIDEQRLDRIDAFFHDHGKKTILIGRFLGLVRALLPFVAGASRVPARRFLPIDYVAAAAWSTTFVTLGYVFWRSFERVISIAKGGSLVLGTVIAAAVAGVLAFRWLEASENRQRLRRAWAARSLGPLKKESVEGVGEDVGA